MHVRCLLNYLLNQKLFFQKSWNFNNIEIILKDLKIDHQRVIICCKLVKLTQMKFGTPLRVGNSLFQVFDFKTKKIKNYFMIEASHDGFKKENIIHNRRIEISDKTFKVFDKLIGFTKTNINSFLSKLRH